MKYLIKFNLCQKIGKDSIVLECDDELLAVEELDKIVSDSYNNKYSSGYFAEIVDIEELADDEDVEVGEFLDYEDY